MLPQAKELQAKILAQKHPPPIYIVLYVAPQMRNDYRWPRRDHDAQDYDRRWDCADAVGWAVDLPRRGHHRRQRYDGTDVLGECRHDSADRRDRALRAWGAAQANLAIGLITVSRSPLGVCGTGSVKSM